MRAPAVGAAKLVSATPVIVKDRLSVVVAVPSETETEKVSVKVSSAPSA